MTSIAENITLIRRRIAALESKYDRPAGSVTLLGVSKRQSLASMREALAAGLSEFGENYAQEAEEKIRALTGANCHWHFIGPLQSNKTRAIAEQFAWVHSVDRSKIAHRLSEQRPAGLPPLNVCVQVNLSGESAKSGVAEAKAVALCAAVAELPRLNLRGLMAIPAPEADFQRQRQTFRRLATLYSELRRRLPQMDTLSMGMSDDYEAAIAEGATLIRLGTALFGPRD